MLLRTKYLICGTVIAVASAALWFIPPVQYELSEEGYIYYNKDWIPVTIFAGFAIVLAVIYLLWQTVKYYRGRTRIDCAPDHSS